MNNTKKLADPELSVHTWNQRMKVGAPVTFRDDFGNLTPTTTRSEASVLGGHTAVVWIEGKAGCVKLDRVAPLD